MNQPPNKRRSPETEAFGIGRSIGHHGEILQGLFAVNNGEPHRGLVTLPCPRAIVSVTYAGTIGADLAVEPYNSRKAIKAARLTLRQLGKAHWGGQISIESDIPPGLGMGSSSSDVIATIRAIATAFTAELAPTDIALLAIAAEAASDPLMVGSEAVLFAHRTGTILEGFGRQLPPMLIVGVNTNPNDTVDTLEHQPAAYEPDLVPVFERLRSDLRLAVDQGDVRRIGRIATASAEINEAYLPKPRFSELCTVAAELGAAGVQVAHSGTVAGLLFDVTSLTGRCCGLSRRLSQAGFAPSTNFVVGGF